MMIALLGETTEPLDEKLHVGLVTDRVRRHDVLFVLALICLQIVFILIIDILICIFGG